MEVIKMGKKITGKMSGLHARINKLERLLIREMAAASNLKEENKRIKDGSLAEYYKKQYFKLHEEHVQLKNEVILMKMEKESEKLKPEDVIFYCSDCESEINAQTDIANEGLCDPCNEGQKEMWAAEQKHEAYEYRDMKL